MATNIRMPKLRGLGPKSGSRSSGHKKLLIIESCAKTEKLKELMMRVEMEYVGGHQYPCVSLRAPISSENSRTNNLLKIVSCAESENLQELMLQVQME